MSWFASAYQNSPTQLVACGHFHIPDENPHGQFLETLVLTQSQALPRPGVKGLEVRPTGHFPFFERSKETFVVQNGSKERPFEGGISFNSPPGSHLEGKEGTEPSTNCLKNAEASPQSHCGCRCSLLFSQCMHF